MKRLALILFLISLSLPFVRGDDNAVNALFKQAQDAASAKKYDDAIALYEASHHPAS